MSSDRPSNRKGSSKRTSVSPKPLAKRKLPKSRTAENLEALLHLLDDEAAPDAAPAPQQKSRNATPGGSARSSRKKPVVVKDESPFMQELARARDDLHKEHRLRVALEEEAETLRRDCASLQQQLVALEKQRHKLQTARFDLESQLDADQRQRELLIDQVDAINARLTTARSRRERVEAELDAAQRECESLKSQLDAARLSQEVAAEELQVKLASMASAYEHLAKDRDALQASVLKQQLRITALAELAKNAEERIAGLEAELAASKSIGSA